jgi:uncharacterized protein (TIGR00725 family)
MADEGNNIVCVFGSGDPREGDERYAEARAVGRVLAELGWVVANGGYGGTMEASARGAVEAGGQAVGVTCSVWSSAPNRYITRRIGTSSLAGRVAALIEIGRGGYVCLPGSTGTLVELATVWEMMFKKLLPCRPLVCVGEFWRPLVDMMVGARGSSGEFVAIVEGPDDLARHFSGRSGG